MTLQAIPGGMYIPRMPNATSGAPTFTTLLIDASGEKAAFVFQVPKTGSVVGVLWRTVTVTTGGNVDVRLETVDLTTGDPSGTLFGTNTNATETVADGDDNTHFETTLTAAASVTKGDLIALVIVAGSPGNMQIAAYQDDGNQIGFPYTDLFTAAWVKTDQGLVCGLVYSDISCAPITGAHPVDIITSNLYSSSSTPDVYALRFKLAFPARISGFWVWGDFDGDFTAKLYDSDGVTVLESLAVDTNVRSSGTGRAGYYLFDTSVNLSANTVYRLGIEPGASNITLYDFSVAVDYVMGSFDGGVEFYLSTAKDPTGTGSWTNTVTKRPMIGLFLDAFDDGVGSASRGFVY